MLAAAPRQLGPELDQSTETDGIASHEVDDVLVLSPQGGLDAAAISALERRATAASCPVLVDLDDCIVVDPHLLRGQRQRRLFEAVQELCIVCGRLSARRLLARAAVAEEIVVFQSVQDALQARAMQRSGYGSGWRLRDAGERDAGERDPVVIIDAAARRIG